MSNTSKIPTIKGFLPLNKFHILPIYDLSPKFIKLSVKNVSRDREKISHCSLLNACAKSLGFLGGFAGYQQEYEEKLLPFMQQNGLFELSNLIQPQFLGKGSGVSLFKLKYQDISERLFFANKPIPKKLFTGYNFPLDECWEDGTWIFNNHIDFKKYGLHNSYFETHKNIDIALSKPDLLVDIYGHDCKHKTRKLIDIVIGSKITEITYSCLNLITDQLFYPRTSKDYEIFLYNPSDNSLENYKKEYKTYQSLLELFTYRIDNQELGWVEILPYNENLIFLKGNNGEYDFVFKNQRDEIFSHQMYAPYLKRAEIPNFDDKYHFERWYYFEFSGFRQEVKHKSEQNFYANNPREDYFKENIVKKYLENHYKKPKFKNLKELDGFTKIKLKNGKILMVSDLISIGDFEVFKSENQDYFNRREKINLDPSNDRLDNLDSVNREKDKSLPVTLTGYDVWKYVHWFNEKYGIETRLLDDKEYLEISPFSSIDWDKENLTNDVDLEEIKNIAFVSPKGELSCRVPYMKENDFQEFTFSFINPTFEYRNGLRFVKSGRFAEWLRTKHCVRSYWLTGWDTISINQSSPPFNSTGKYHYIKIGFRLCYELEV